MTERDKFPGVTRADATPFASHDPTRVIARALLDARRRGLDDVSQVRFAAAAVMSVRPDLSSRDVARSVETVCRQANLSERPRHETFKPLAKGPQRDHPEGGGTEP